MKEYVSKEDFIRLENKVDSLSKIIYIGWGIVIALQVIIPIILKS